MLMIFIWCQQDIMTSSCAKRQPLNRSYDLLFDASDVGHTCVTTPYMIGVLLVPHKTYPICMKLGEALINIISNI